MSPLDRAESVLSALVFRDEGDDLAGALTDARMDSGAAMTVGDLRFLFYRVPEPAAYEGWQ